MLQITADAAYADIMETVMFNSLLAGVSLDGEGYFYTNPLSVVDELSHDLRWPKNREGYISYCNCCPPNTIRTIAELQEYFYSKSDDGIYIHFYGSNELKTAIGSGSIAISQETNYPWDGKVKISIEDFPVNSSIYLRIPGWAKMSAIKYNGITQDFITAPASYVRILKAWKEGDIIELDLVMEPVLIEANPLVEETRNQVAVKRGPLVYCLESPDLPEGARIFDFIIPSDITLNPVKSHLQGSDILSLEGDFINREQTGWNNILYREIGDSNPESARIKLIPYYAWNNRGNSEMTVWLPVCR
jgi:DUF1680 family protein